MTEYKVITIKCIVANCNEPENARADLFSSAGELGLHVIDSYCAPATDAEVAEAKLHGFDQ